MGLKHLKIFNRQRTETTRFNSLEKRKDISTCDSQTKYLLEHTATIVYIFFLGLLRLKIYLSTTKKLFKSILHFSIFWPANQIFMYDTIFGMIGC